ncbi:MAG: electron transport complex subunit RsxC [Peptococcaceae bacterium]|nr:electron transport complex subunit RsxC [Peptococcaceae bacterium]
MFGSKPSVLGGVHVKHNKYTENCETKRITPPETVTILMSQHIGASCVPTVKVGDEVTKGQVIGDTEAFVSAPIHASVSGKVTKVDSVLTSGGAMVPAVIIASDGEDRVDPALTPPVVTDRASFLAAVRASGLVGLGGAGFPTHVKLNPQPAIDTLVINGAECEPYITSDYRECMEQAEDIFYGIAAVQKYLEIPNVIIGIESNKPAAIKKLSEMAKDYPGVSVLTLPALYPQGAEKVLIYSATKRVLPEGKLPADIGVIVMNVTSVGFLARYLKTGMPLVEKRITVDGGAIKEKGNIIVPIGTSIQYIADAMGGFVGTPAKILMGGPMMGIALYQPDAPLVKNNNAILFLDEKDLVIKETTNCIRCGKCIEACPFNLMPAALEGAYQAKNIDALKALKVNLCMECGCCSYICPANRPLVESNHLGKLLLRNAGK